MQRWRNQIVSSTGLQEMSQSKEICIYHNSSKCISITQTSKEAILNNKTYTLAFGSDTGLL
jgi:hypothetical protein